MPVSADELTALATFARIVEERSITRAAQALGVSKSTASGRLSSLEARLQVKLLRRTTRSLSLTDEGRRLYERCAQLLHTADDALSEVHAAGAVPEGLLRVAAPVGFGVLQLAPALGEFSARCPDVTVELLLSDGLARFVEDRVDVAIRVGRRLRDATLAVHRLGAERYVLCASPAYVARRGRPSRPEDLADHECLRRRADHTWDVAAGARRVTVRVQGRIIADDTVFLRQAALEGIGIARIPRALVEADLAAGRLVPVLDRWSQGEDSVFAVLTAHKHQPAKVRAFVEFVAALFRRR